MQIIPAILALDEESFERDLRRIEESGDFEWVHIDFCDGKFVETKTIGLEEIKKYPTKLNLEYHFMVEDVPEVWMHQLAEHPAGQKIRFILHLESGTFVDQQDEAEEIMHWPPYDPDQYGFALNPQTPLSVIEDFKRGKDSSKVDNDCILIMGVNPGSQGQEFLPGVLEKVKEAAKRRNELASPRPEESFLIGVDGGVSAENVREIFEAGADYVVVGSHLLEGDINENLQKIKKIAG